MLTPVTLADARFLYDLLAERAPGVSISHRSMPTWEEHLAFMQSSPYAAWYIVGDRAGSIYLTRQDEIGIHLRTQGQGIGTKAVRQLMALHPRKRYLANISPANPGSIRFFSRLGFSCIQHTFEIRHDT